MTNPIIRRVIQILCVGSLLWGAVLWHPVPAAAGGGGIVRVSFSSPEQLAALVAQLDVWEVDPEAGYLVAHITPAGRAWLVDGGFQVQPHALASLPSGGQPQAIPDYPCYRTIDELYAQLHTWVGEYPGLSELVQIGESYGDPHVGLPPLPLWVLRVTNKALPGPKPVLFIIAGIHGRELITPEVAMVFIETLLTGYRSDPEITWLLDAHEMYVMPSANPDGHIKNEPGWPWAYWRKNTHPYGTCGDDGYGVDLNRNSSFRWGGPGTSMDPCAITFRGFQPASEPEVQAVQTFMAQIFPDQRGPGDDDAAPDDTTGVFISLHSYSDLVLWPWGDVATPAPNGDQLAMLGQKMATFNRYRAYQSNNLYPVSGSTDDWAYGTLGVAAYTFEIGKPDDGFYPSCTRYDDLVGRNIPALLYAAKVARTPYLTPFGPDALDLSLLPATAPAGETLALSAIIDDQDNGAARIVRAAYSVDVPHWAGGVERRVWPSDAFFDSDREAVSVAVPTTGLAPGQHMLYVRGQDEEGYWGPVSATFFELLPISVSYLPLVMKGSER